MTIRKFEAKTMAEGLRKVRDALGADAMIMQTLKRNGHIELFVETGSQHRLPQQAPGAAAEMPVEVASEVIAEFKRARMRMLDALEEARAVPVAAQAPLVAPAPVEPARVRERDPDDFSSFDDILQSIKADGRERTAATDIDPNTDPITGKVNIKAIIERLQVQPALAAKLVQCRRIDELMDNLAAQISVVGEGTIPAGIMALVGPAGSGKTTTLIKLVTRQVMQFGPKSVAIIGCDRFRAGAQEQLAKVASLLDVPFIQVSAKMTLPMALGKLAHRKLVLIDMPGVSMRDPELALELEKLDSSGFVIKRYLTLQANLQLEVMQMAVAVYAGERVTGEKNLPGHSVAEQHTQVILTKLDECCNFGAALSLLAETRLPLAFTTDGPHIPEDLAAARAVPLVQQALALLRGKFAKQPRNDLTKRGRTEMVSGL